MDYPSMYHAAMEYIKMGLAVFPLEERGKRPITRNGCKDATTDAAQVKAWWQQYPESNIGIATGSRSGGIFVIDLDVDEDRGIDGYHMLEDWQRENGRFPDTWTAITGRGGYLPWEHINKYREWNNADDSNLKSYIESRYGLKSMEKIMEALNVVMNRNPYNPVKEMLESIYKKWDKKTGYIENLLPDYLGVEKTDYATECMKLFMLGAISRAYYPGCKFDYMPVFVGKQGIGKSTFLRLLAMNNSWYNDNFNTVEGDKAPEKLRGMWMVELAELLATKKAKEVESIKAFLTSTVDTYRPPYGRRTEQRPRVCVFAGTTNNDHFLTDRTGNRRFLPIVTRKEYVKKSMFENQEAVIRDFENAWGEAMQLFKDANEKPVLILPKKMQEYVENKQAEYMEEDVRVGIIQEWLNHTKEEAFKFIVQLCEIAIFCINTFHSFFSCRIQFLVSLILFMDFLIGLLLFFC